MRPWPLRSDNYDRISFVSEPPSRLCIRERVNEREGTMEGGGDVGSNFPSAFDVSSSHASPPPQPPVLGNVIYSQGRSLTHSRTPPRLCPGTTCPGMRLGYYRQPTTVATTCTSHIFVLPQTRPISAYIKYGDLDFHMGCLRV